MNGLVVVAICTFPLWGWALPTVARRRSVRRVLRSWLTVDGWKWRLAYLLDRSDDMCWSSLCSWVQFDRPLRECRIDWICEKDTAANGSCYCGKVEQRDGVPVVVR